MSETNGLTNKRQVFVEEYLKCWNGTEAARRAQYAYPEQEAYRLLRNAEIAAVIEERIKKKAMDADEVLAHLADIARFDPGRLFGKGGVIDWDKAKVEGDTRFIHKMEWGDGKLKVEMYNRMDALELLGKHLRLFVERQEVSGPGGGPIEHSVQPDLSQLTDQELDSLASIAERFAGDPAREGEA